MKVLLTLLSVVLIVSSTAPAVRAEEESKVSMGLKEALQSGVKNAVQTLGVEDGYLKNLDVKILMPEKLKKVEDVMKSIGMEKYSDELVEKMNRAAELAAPKSQEIFMESIKGISFEDAVKILQGKETEATDYLKSSAGEALTKEFYPIVKDSMEQVKAIKAYNDFIEKYSANPMMEPVKMDISEHVTDKAIDGLFKMIAQEEMKIRQDPAARTTDLLNDVFGGMFK